jgi:hypothetical protein
MSVAGPTTSDVSKGKSEIITELRTVGGEGGERSSIASLLDVLFSLGGWETILL